MLNSILLNKSKINILTVCLLYTVNYILTLSMGLTSSINSYIMTPLGLADDYTYNERNFHMSKLFQDFITQLMCKYYQGEVIKFNQTRLETSMLLEVLYRNLLHNGGCYSESYYDEVDVLCDTLMDSHASNHGELIHDVNTFYHKCYSLYVEDPYDKLTN